MRAGVLQESERSNGIALDRRDPHDTLGPVLAAIQLYGVIVLWSQRLLAFALTNNAKVMRLEEIRRHWKRLEEIPLDMYSSEQRRGRGREIKARTSPITAPDVFCYRHCD